MLPADLKPGQFSGYPPEAKKLAVEYLGTLQRLPLSFAPNLLRQVIDYDFLFPAERVAVEKELHTLSSLGPDQLSGWVQAFADISISPQLERSDWVNEPARFVELLSAHLWTTHQLDAFRTAAIGYADRLRAAVPPERPPIPRLGIAVIGQGVTSYGGTVFRKLRADGGYFSNVSPDNGLGLLLDTVTARAKRQPAAYAHWYIDGGEPVPHDPGLTTVSYAALQPVRAAILAKMRSEIKRPGMGPESLRTILAAMRPAEAGFSKDADPVLARFQLKLLTEGSGTQIFSTSFAQWGAREALRRAQPLTLLVRFSPRQRQKPMDELLSARNAAPELDPVGSLIDGDMGAYYNWINQQRLSGAEDSAFVAWFEGHNQAVAIGPGLPRGTQSNAAVDLGRLLSWVS